MNLIAPFTILTQNFHEMVLIRDAMKHRRLATERLHDDYRKIYKNYQFAWIINKKSLSNWKPYTL